MGEAAERSQRVLKVQAAKYNIPGLSYGVAFDEKQPFSSCELFLRDPIYLHFFNCLIEPNLDFFEAYYFLFSLTIQR